MDEKYYNVSFDGDKLLIKTEKFEKTNFEKNLEEGDKIVIVYTIKSSDEKCKKNLITETKVKAFFDEKFEEKQFKQNLL